MVSIQQYPTSVTFTPIQVIKEYNKILQSFIWDGKRPKVAYKTLILPIPKGGLKLLDLNIRIQMNMQQWVKRILKSPESNTAHYLTRATGCPNLPDYLSSKQPDKPSWVMGLKFYGKMHQICDKFLCFQSTNEQEVRQELVWNNRWITSGGIFLYLPQC